MKQETCDKILACWDAMADDDASTERLIAMTADTCRVEYETVVRALGMRAAIEQTARELP